MKLQEAYYPGPSNLPQNLGGQEKVDYLTDGLKYFMLKETDVEKIKVLSV